MKRITFILVLILLVGCTPETAEKDNLVCMGEGQQISLMDIRTKAVSQDEICCAGLNPVGCSVDIGYCTNCGDGICKYPEDNCNCEIDCEVNNMEVRSPAFSSNGFIPTIYTCMGHDFNPPLEILDVPDGTISMVLIVDDPDASGGNWDHWIVFNIPPTNKIEENIVPEGSVQAVNDFGRVEYGGPCPPSGRHRYFFKVYALDTMLNLEPGSKKSEIEAAMQGHVLAQAQLMGVFEK